jgi:16S rRNA (adenine1518-N6/adenine1519-N6)-dimethyltransferase
MDLTKPSELSRLLKAHGLHLTKRLGQNFLVDRTHLLRVVDTAGVNEEDRIFEIGPGAGTLTIELAQRAKRLVSVELDRGLLPVLADVLAPFSNATVVHADALRLDLPVFLSEHLEASPSMPVKVVANIPYNITSPLLARLLENKELFTSITLMVQKEVARRLAAPPGTADYGSFSVFAQFHAHVSVASIVPRGAFFPAAPGGLGRGPSGSPPGSAGRRTFGGGLFPCFASCLRTAAKNPHERADERSGAECKGFDRAAIENAVTAASIDGQRRGETLSLDELAAISRALFSAPPFADA